jgi:hypothetical protein
MGVTDLAARHDWYARRLTEEDTGGATDAPDHVPTA